KAQIQLIEVVFEDCCVCLFRFQPKDKAWNPYRIHHLIGGLIAEHAFYFLDTTRFLRLCQLSYRLPEQELNLRHFCLLLFASF
ncbi:MAG: hypothetical protein KBF14_00635, partial [Synergistaceae bacterium]|nr:hypothetical protein [Synergistaceae bacterium]